MLNYAGGKSEDQTDGQLFVEIADEKGQPIYLSTTAFQSMIGSATYLNIVIAADAKPLGDPPAAVRSSAFPDATEKG